VNQAILDRVNRSGRIYMTHTRLDDRLTLRFCVAQTHTEARHVENAWALIREAATAVESEPDPGPGSSKTGPRPGLVDLERGRMLAHRTAADSSAGTPMNPATDETSFE